jgi:Lrp/AsnC family transcriptional regulator, leucine-responsive regulatory protein
VNHPLDAKDFKILVALHRNARLSYRSLGSRVSLSAPAVRERLRRLERSGVLRGFGLWIDPEVFDRDEVLTFFKRERTQEEVLALLSAPEVAWIGWKADGGLTVGQWSVDIGRSVEQLAAALAEEPSGQAIAPRRAQPPLGRLDWAIIDALIDDPRISFGELTAATYLSPKTVRKHLERLIEAETIVVMPRQGAVEGSGELVYHLAVAGEVTVDDLRNVIPDAMLIHATSRPPMKYLLCRSTDFGEVTTKTSTLRKLIGVESATTTLNKDLLFARGFEHLLVREQMKTRPSDLEHWGKGQGTKARR